jgi:hypothetical protein
MVGHRGVLGEDQQRGARAADELGDDAWSGAGAVVGLGWRGNSSGWRCCRAAEEVEEGEEQGEALGADLQNQKFQGPHCEPKFPANLQFK